MDQCVYYHFRTSVTDMSTEIFYDVKQNILKASKKLNAAFIFKLFNILFLNIKRKVLRDDFNSCGKFSVVS